MYVCVLKTNVSSFSVVCGKKKASELWAHPPWSDSVSSQHCSEWGCAPVQRLSHSDACHSCRQWVCTQGKKIAFHFQETIVSLTSHGTRDIWPFLSGPGTWGGRSSWASSGAALPTPKEFLDPSLQCLCCLGALFWDSLGCWPCFLLVSWRHTALFKRTF